MFDHLCVWIVRNKQFSETCCLLWRYSIFSLVHHEQWEDDAHCSQLPHPYLLYYSLFYSISITRLNILQSKPTHLVKWCSLWSPQSSYAVLQSLSFSFFNQLLLFSFWFQIHESKGILSPAFWEWTISRSSLNFPIWIIYLIVATIYNVNVYFFYEASEPTSEYF